MSNPVDPGQPEPTDAQPTEAYPAADAQPTEAYPSADAQPTEAYPSAGNGASYDAPAQAPVHPAPPAYGTPPAYSGQPAYGAQQPAYGAPAAYPQSYAPAPSGPDTRSKKVATIALILGGVGLLFTLLGFLPILWVSLVLVLLGGLLLLGGFITSIIGLAGKNNGGKGLSITALILSIIGGAIWVFALGVSLLWIGLSQASTSTGQGPAPEESSITQPSEEGTDEGSGTDATTGEAAFLAEVRPKVEEIMKEIDPNATPELVQLAFPDEALITIGQSLKLVGDAGLDAAVDAAIAADGSDAATQEQFRELYQAILESAEAHL